MTKLPIIAEQHASRCIHLNAARGDDVCGAGVRIHEVVDKSVRPHAWPCWLDDPARSSPTCRMRRLPTAEETVAYVAQHEATMRARIGY